MDVLICRADPNTDSPVFDGPQDEPVWSLYANDVPGPHWGDWQMSMHGTGLTHAQALSLADALGLDGHLMS